MVDFFIKYNSWIIKVKKDITWSNGGYNYSPYYIVLTFVQFGSNLMKIIHEYMNTMYTYSS